MVEIVWACHLYGPLGYLRCWRGTVYRVAVWMRDLKRVFWSVNARLYAVWRNERWMKGKDLRAAVMSPLC
jgi:hypothetical protein